MNIGTVEGTLRLRDDFTSRLKMAAGQLQVTGKKMEAVGRQMSAAGAGLTKAVTLPILAIGGGAVKAFGDFDSAMTKSLAIMGQVDDAMRTKMTSAAREVAKTTTFSAKQAAESYFFLASAGLDAAQSVAALPQVAKFAQAGAFDMALATDLLTDAQSALGLTIRDDVVANMENMARVSDVLVKANNLANATVQQFSTSLTTEAGAALKSFHIDVEEGVAVLAAFADQGVKAEVAGTGLSRILRLMTSAAVKNSEAYKRLKVSVFDSDKNIRNLADIVTDLENALGGLADQERVVALEALGFKARVQGVILPLLGTSEAIRRYERELRAAGGTTEEVANRQLRSLWAQLGLVKDRFVDAFITLGASVVPTLRSFSKNVLIPLADALGRVAQRFGELPGPIKSVAVAFAALAAAAGPVLFLAGGLVSGLGAVATFAPAAVAAFAAFGAKLAAFGAIASRALALFTGPAGWIIAGVSLLLAWKPVRDILADLGQRAFKVLAEAVARARAQLEEWWRSTAEARKFLADLARVISDMLARALKVYVEAQIEFYKWLGRTAAQVAEYSGLLYVLETVILNVSRAIEVQIAFLKWLGGVLYEVIGGYEGLKKILLVVSPVLGLALVHKDLEDGLARITGSTQEAAVAIGSLKAAVKAGGGIIPRAIYDRAIAAQETLLQRITDTGHAITAAKAAGKSAEMVSTLEQEKATYEGQLAILGRVLATVQGIEKAKKDGAAAAGGGVTPESEEMAKFRAELEASMRSLRAIADAWGRGTAAGLEAVRVAELEAAIHERTQELKGAELAIAQKMLRVEDELRRTAVGAERLALLSEEKTILEGQLRALEEGAAAAAEAAEAWEQWKREIEQTTGVAEEQKDAVAAVAEVVAALQRRLATRAENRALALELNQLKALQAEYGRGPAALEKLRQAQELENKVRQGTIGLVGVERATRATLIVLLDRQQKKNAALANDQAIRANIAAMERQLAAYRSGARTLQQLEEALRLANLETEIQNRLFADGVTRDSKRGRQIVALAEQQAALAKATAEAGKRAEQLAIDVEQIGKNFLEGVQRSFQGFFREILDGSGDTLKNFGESIKNLLFDVLAEYLAKWLVIQAKMLAASLKRIAAEKAAQQAANATANKNKTSTGDGGIGSLFSSGSGGGLSASVVAWGAVAAIVAGIGYSLGWWGGGETKRGSGTFGGGADPELFTAMGENAVFIARRFREAGKILGEVAKELDLEITRLGQVTLNKIGKNYNIGGASLAVLGIENTAEAISEAVAVMSIRGAEFGRSVTAFVEAVIRGSNAVTQEQLRSELELARMVESFGLSDFEIKIKGIGAEMNRIFDWLGAQLADNAEQMLFGLQRSVAEEIDRWQAGFNELLGIEPTPQEQQAQLERRARVYEAEKALRLADLRARVLQMEAEKQLTISRVKLGVESLKAQGRIETGRHHLELELTRSRYNFTLATARVYEAEETLTRSHLETMGGIVQAGASVLDLQINALNELIAAIEAIPTIDFKKLKIPKAGGKGGAKGEKATDQDQLRGILAAFDLSLLGSVAQSIADINATWEENIRLAHGDVQLLEQVNKMKAQQLALMKQTLRAEVAQYAVLAAQGGGIALLGGQMSEWDRRAQEIADWADRVAADNELLAQETGSAALETWEIIAAEANRMRELVDEAIGSLSLPLEETRERFAVLGDTMAFLRQQVEAGTISQERYAEVIAQLADQQFIALADGLSGFLQKYYGDVEGFEALRRQLEVVRFNVELANLKMQFDLLKGLGLLTAETIALIDSAFKYIDENPIDWDKFLSGGGGGGGGAGAGGGGGSNPFEDAMRLLEQYEEAAAGGGSQALGRFRQIQADFATIFATLGRGERTMRAFNAAVADLIGGLTDQLTDIRDQLLGGGAGGADRASVDAALATAQDLVRRAQSADMAIRLPALEALPAALQTLLSAATSAFGAGPESARLRQWVLGVIAQLVGGGRAIQLPTTAAAAVPSTGGNVIEAAGRFGVPPGIAAAAQAGQHCCLSSEMDSLRSEVRAVRERIDIGNRLTEAALDYQSQTAEGVERIGVAAELNASKPVKSRAKTG